ncbi:hypothetical protein Tco_0974854 [Tanacetum coccineum]|uniref:Uncharacterized protein n=1 Tax=Tanacetum coccineum TaxID=301880 RepID=A0ABQ5ECW9_9ASTR
MIIQVIKTYWGLGHEYKFIIEIVARRANECIMSITEPDYKNLNKNDIEDMYLLIMNGKHVEELVEYLRFGIVGRIGGYGSWQRISIGLGILTILRLHFIHDNKDYISVEISSGPNLSASTVQVQRFM